MGRLILYHGTTEYFDKVDLEKSKASKDFGQGFYTTESAKQAIWTRYCTAG